MLVSWCQIVNVPFIHVNLRMQKLSHSTQAELSDNNCLHSTDPKYTKSWDINMCFVFRSSFAEYNSCHCICSLGMNLREFVFICVFDKVVAEGNMKSIHRMKLLVQRKTVSTVEQLRTERTERWRRKKWAWRYTEVWRTTPVLAPPGERRTSVTQKERQTGPRQKRATKPQQVDLTAVVTMEKRGWKGFKPTQLLL